MRITRPFGAAIAAVAAVALLAGCGTTSPAADDTSAPAGDPITLVDGSGAEVVLPNGPAQRVVALEWAQAEILSSLGVELVGVSDIEGYTSWVGTAQPLAGAPTDVGSRTEPSVEAIADLEPDLIVGAPRSVPDAVRAQMDEIAPVLLLENANAADPLTTIGESVTTLATAVGKGDQATPLMDELDASIEANRARIGEAGLTDTPVVFASPYAEGANVQIRMHGVGSAPGAVLQGLGLGTAWTDPGDEGYGLSYTDVEGLTALPADSRFLYWANADEADAVEANLAPNAVWQSLPFVQEGHVVGVAEGIWAYGGPKSLAAFADDVTQKLGA